MVLSGLLDSSNQSSKLCDIHYFLALSNKCIGGIVVVDDDDGNDCKEGEEDCKLLWLLNLLFKLADNKETAASVA